MVIIESVQQIAVAQVRLLLFEQCIQIVAPFLVGSCGSCGYSPSSLGAGECCLGVGQTGAQKSS
jgi:hypothetical protein